VKVLHETLVKNIQAFYFNQIGALLRKVYAAEVTILDKIEVYAAENKFYAKRNRMLHVANLQILVPYR
jgi:hypothetical protein